MLLNITYFAQCLANCVSPTNGISSSNFITSNNLLSNAPDVCTTPGCVQAANVLLSNMDSRVDPCENFYQYACGKYLEDNHIPDDQISVDRFSDISNRLQYMLRGLFEAPPKTTEALPKQLVSFMYNTCMDKAAHNSEGSKPLRNMLNSLPYKWPLINGNTAGVNFDISGFLSTIYERYGTDTLITGSVGVDDKNPTTKIYTLFESGLALQRDYYLNDTAYGKYQQAYRKFVKDITTLLAQDAVLSLPQDYNQQLEDMYNFEKRIAQITPTPEEQRDLVARYNKLTLRDLQTRISWLRWDQILKKQFPPSTTHLVNPDLSLLVTSPKFFQDLGTVVRSTDSRTVLNFILWRFAFAWLPRDDLFENIDDEFAKALLGREQKPARWKLCTSEVNSKLDKAAGAIFVKKYFDNSAKSKVQDMVNNLKAVFKEMLNSNDWMDNETRQAALTKLASFYDLIGFDNWLLNDTRLVKYYEGLYFNASNTPFEVQFALHRWSVDFEFRKLLIPNDRTQFEMPAAEVNAMYDPWQNSITFPAGILQAPFYHPDYPQFMNYGGIGAVIGHEITHGFDDQGRLYNDQGQLTDWWTPVCSGRFNAKADCVADQYSQYRAPEANNMNVNGRLTLGENIADLGGVKMAYKAYKQYLKQLGRAELRLPGLQQVSNEQLFFLSYANNWCEKMTSETATAMLLSNPHSPGEFRVLGPLANSQEFAEAFACRRTTQYNPSTEKRCSIW